MKNGLNRFDILPSMTQKVYAKITTYAGSKNVAAFLVTKDKHGYIKDNLAKITAERLLIAGEKGDYEIADAKNIVDGPVYWHVADWDIMNDAKDKVKYTLHVGTTEGIEVYKATMGE